MGARALAGRAALAYEATVRARWRHRLLTGGTDVTARSATASCLVLAPHPDDETIGCGATIHRKRAAGTAVRVLVAADGRSSHVSDLVAPDALARLRAEEVAAAVAELGVAPGELVQLGMADDSLGERGAELADRIAAEVASMRPDEVLVTSDRDWHPDHRALHAAAVDALQRLARPPRLLAYPVWSWIHGPWTAAAGGPWPARRSPGYLVAPVDPRPWRAAALVATAGHLAAKRRALAAHRSQLTNLTGEEGWAVLDDGFVAAFHLTHEVSFPVEVHGRPTAARARGGWARRGR